MTDVLVGLFEDIIYLIMKEVIRTDKQIVHIMLVVSVQDQHQHAELFKPSVVTVYVIIVYKE
jgi:hypothetical protein